MNSLEEWKKLINNGFLLIPLYGINEKGNCTCYKGAECTAAGKHPIEKDWQNKFITTIEQLDLLYKKYSDMNIGIITGGDFIVVDVDPRHGGMDSYEDYKHIFYETLTVHTGGGGLHLYYKKPKGVNLVPNKTNLLQGIDIRGDGGLVVAPGSQHKSGNYYIIKED